MFHYNPRILQQQQQQVQFQAQQRQVSQQNATAQNNSPQKNNKLSGITPQSFDIYGVQDPTFLIPENTGHVYSQQQQQQQAQQQQLQTYSNASIQREQPQYSQTQAQATFQSIPQETSRPAAHPGFENTHPMMEYLEANQAKNINDSNQAQWNNQQLLNINTNHAVEDSSLSSNNSTPNQSSSNSKIKRPMNAFLIYSVKRRRELSHENPALTTSEISTILGDEWAKMDPNLKNSYILQAQMLKSNFDSEHPDYVYTRRPNNTRKKKKSNPDSFFPNNGYPMNPYGMYYPYPFSPIPFGYQASAMKQPPNAFLIFNRSIRPKIRDEFPDASISEISRRVSEAWKNLSEEEKDKYYVEAKNLRKEFTNFKRLTKDTKGKDLNMNTFLPISQPSNGSSTSNSASNMNYVFPPAMGIPPFAMSPIPKRRLRTPKDPTQPKHPSSAFIFFLREVRPQFAANNPKSDLGSISKMISAAWKKLSADEKAKYIQLSEEDKKRYTIEMEMWMEAKKQKDSNASKTENKTS